MSRKLTACVLLFGFAALFLVAHRAEPVAAQGQKEKGAEKQLKAAKAELADAEKQIAVLKAEVVELKAALKKATKDDKSDDKTIKSLQSTLDGYRKAGLVHFVVLKLKTDSPASEAQSVIDDTYKDLAKIKGVRGVWAGRPSDNGSPDYLFTDYTVALAFVFDDPSTMRRYLDDPVHKKFADKHLKLWETPVVYDFEPKK